jgi:hypothetical protein
VVSPIVRRPRSASAFPFLVVFLALLPGTAFPQSSAPLATNLAALLTYTDFYEGKQVVVRGEFVQANDRTLLKSGDGGRTVPVLLRDATPSGLVDVRGELWDVGKMKPDDPKATGYDLARIATPAGSDWPKPGELLVLAVRSFGDAIRPVDPTIRAVVLEPERYEGRPITLRGQYGARNLLGELPRAPGVSRYDFVIRSAGGAIWVTGMRPRGRDFDFDLDSKVDTARWLEVTGTLKQGRGLQWIEAKSLRMTQPLKGMEPGADAATPVAPPPGPPPQVIFSIPTEGETEVPITTTVRIQTSRDLDAASLQGHIRIGYLGQQPGTPPIEFAVGYDPGNRAIEIKFARPLERFRTLRLELVEGIVSTDKQKLAPWTLTFSLGG